MTDKNYEFTDQGIQLSNGELITWDTINKENGKIKFRDKILVKFDFRYGRDDLYEHTIVDKTEWEELIEKLYELDIDSTYLGELCGKHSEVYYSLSTWPPTVITDIEEIYNFYNINGYSDRNCDAYIMGSFSDRIYEETGE